MRPSPTENRPILLHSQNDDEVLCTIADAPPLLPCREVEAVCQKISGV